MKDDLPDDLWQECLTEAQRELYHLALSLGGTITGEHGIGATRRGYLAEAIGPEAVAIMRTIKDAIDPLGIMNPQKVFA